MLSYCVMSRTGKIGGHWLDSYEEAVSQLNQTTYSDTYKNFDNHIVISSSLLTQKQIRSVSDKCILTDKLFKRSKYFKNKIVYLVSEDKSFKKFKICADLKYFQKMCKILSTENEYNIFCKPILSCTYEICLLRELM